MSDASSSFVHPGTQTLSHLDFNDMPCLDATERDPFSTYIALFADPPEQIQGYQGVPEWGDVSTQPLHSLLSPLADDELGDDVFCVTAADQSSQDSPSRSTESSSPQPANSIKSAGVGATLNKGARNSRKQNHSCDQCRAAKRACDLPQDVSINGQKPTNICTTCKRRGVECTVTWLVDRKSQRHNRKRPRTTSYIQTDSCVATCPEERVETPPVDRETFALSREGDLARQLVGRDTLSQQFNLYVEVLRGLQGTLVSLPDLRQFYEDTL